MNKFFKRIILATILATCCTVSVFSMTACNEGKDYSEDIAKLQQQIEDLQTENNTLKDKVNNLTPGGVDYTEEIEKLQQQIETLKAQNTQLTEQASNQQKLIESLQSATKIYKVGETFTYSYQGIDFFSIKLSIDPEYNWWQITIKNLKMDSFKECGYVSYYVINKTGTIGGAFKVTDTIDQNNEINCDIRSVDSNYIKLVVGFPLQDNNLIPYAVFDLTSSV